MPDNFDTQLTLEEEEFEDNFIEDGWIEFEPGKFIYDEMSANP